MRLARSRRSGHRLHDFRASLPREITVTALHHPLFGQRLEVRAWSTLRGVVHLVVTLPDGTPGTIELGATSAGGDAIEPQAATILSVDGVRRLRTLLEALSLPSGRRQA